MKTLLLFTLVLTGTTLAYAAPPPDTMYQKASGAQFNISAGEMQMGRHINLRKGGYEGKDVFTGEVKATIGDTYLLCDRATYDERGYAFVAPMVHINDMTLTAERMVYNSRLHNAVLTNVLEYNNGAHHHDYYVIDFPDQK